MLMKYVLTICSKEKSRCPTKLPAIERYLNPRLAWVQKLSREGGAKMLILSGKYGILKPKDPILYYDHKLNDQMVEGVTRKVTGQLKELNTKEIVFYGEDVATNPDWKPYYEVVRSSCRKLNIKLEIRRLITPSIVTIIGDFGSGKTTLAEHFAKTQNNSFMVEGIFDYLGKETFKKFTEDRDKSKAYRLNKFRDSLIENSNESLAISDEDILELIAYEFSCMVTNRKNIYQELLGNLKKYRNQNKHLYPCAYIYLIADRATRLRRIDYRTKTDRPTSSYFLSSLTQASYRRFYDEVTKSIPSGRMLKLDTTDKTPREVFAKVNIFVNKVLGEDYKFINTINIIEKLDLGKLRQETLYLHEKEK